MIFWITVAIVTAVVAVLLILPLTRATGPLADDRDKEQSVYRDQLTELDRDRAGGLISDAEAEYARAEISRRLLAASSTAAGASTAVGSAMPLAASKRRLRLRLAELAVIVALPAIAVPLYLEVGAPGLPAQPLAERLANPGDNIGLLLAKVERHLLQQPEDGAGWDLVAPIYYRNQLFDKAADAYRNALRILGPTVDRSGGFAETLIAGESGKVNDEAVAALQDVLVKDPGNPRARFYMALRLEQDGKRAEAFAAFTALKKDAPAGANWVDLVSQHVAVNDPAAPAPKPEAAAPGNPDAGDIAAASGMTAGDRQQMILGMVETLDARLKNEPDNFEGWVRLIRSYGVLNMPDRAADALKRATVAFPPETDKGRQILDIARSMGLRPEGSAQ
nr:c-type cytochrome biogenesis protein CcmI [uncultured Gellertiella sp.]